MFKSIKQKVLDSITAHPKLTIFGIGFALMSTIGLVTGFLSQDASALPPVASEILKAIKGP